MPARDRRWRPPTSKDTIFDPDLWLDGVAHHFDESPELRVLGPALVAEILLPTVSSWQSRRERRYRDARPAVAALRAWLDEAWNGGDMQMSADRIESFATLARLRTRRDRFQNLDLMIAWVFQTLLRLRETSSDPRQHASVLIDLLEAPLGVTSPLVEGLGYTGQDLRARAENDAVQMILRQASLGLLERATTDYAGDLERLRADARTIGDALWTQLEKKVPRKDT